MPSRQNPTRSPAGRKRGFAEPAGGRNTFSNGHTKGQLKRKTSTEWAPDSLRGSPARATRIVGTGVDHDVSWGAPETDAAAWNVGPSSRRTDELSPRFEVRWEKPYSDVHWEQTSPDVATWENEVVDMPPLTLEEFKMKESQMRVDQVNDVVPFWIRGIEAAWKGEVYRMEEFLENMAKNRSSAWHRNQARLAGWGGGGWNALAWDGDHRGWGREWVDQGSLNHEMDDDMGSIQSTNSAFEGGQDVEQSRPCDVLDAIDDSFVEDIALQEAVDPERKRRMHHFFRMSTEDKVKVIHAMVHGLHD